MRHSDKNSTLSFLILKVWCNIYWLLNVLPLVRLEAQQKKDKKALISVNGQYYGSPFVFHKKKNPALGHKKLYKVIIMT